MVNDNYEQERMLPYTNLLASKYNEMQKSHKDKQKKRMYYIEERRKEVAQMLAQGHNETEIAQILGSTCKYYFQRC
jgi:DNA-binding NarL/FixJ family response regulator